MRKQTPDGGSLGETILDKRFRRRLTELWWINSFPCFNYPYFCKHVTSQLITLKVFMSVYDDQANRRVCEVFMVGKSPLQPLNPADKLRAEPYEDQFREEGQKNGWGLFPFHCDDVSQLSDSASSILCGCRQWVLTSLFTENVGLSNRPLTATGDQVKL